MAIAASLLLACRGAPVGPEGAAEVGAVGAAAAGAPGATTEPAALWFGGDVHLGVAPRGGLSAITAIVGGGAGIVNLEGPIAAAEGGARVEAGRDGAPGTVWLANPAAAPAFLRAEGVVAASVANNHAADDGAVGDARTRDRLREAGVAPFGGAAGPARLVVGDVDVALFAYDLRDGGAAGAGAAAAPGGVPDRILADFAVGGGAAAPGGAPDRIIADFAAAGGAAAPGEVADRIIADFAAAGGAADPAATSSPSAIEVVALHVTGPPSYLPRPELVAAVDAAVAAGADIVVAHGTHVVGPVERRGDTVIAWGLGNLLFDCACTDETEALVLRVELTAALPAEIVPIAAGLGGAPALPAPDPDGVLDLVAGLGGTPMTRAGASGRF